MPGIFSLEGIAERLGVDPEWLAEEAKADRIPGLQAGGKMLFCLRAVEKVLYARINAMATAVGVKEYVERAQGGEGDKKDG